MWKKQKQETFKCVCVLTHFEFVRAANSNTEPLVLKNLVSTLKLDVHLKISYMYFYKMFNLIEHSKCSEGLNFPGEINKAKWIETVDEPSNKRITYLSKFCWYHAVYF